MLGHRTMTMEDYINILRRHKLLIVVPAIVLCGAAYFVSLKLPKKYESTSTVLVEGQRVSNELVKNLETGDPNQKLASMKERIMSNSTLQPIVDRFGLFNNRGLSMEARVAELQTAIHVIPVEQMAQTHASALPGFHISVTLNDPHLAQEVCGEITSMFIEEDTRSREQNGTNTMEFMNDQVRDAQTKMNEQADKLAQFKQQYLGALPDQEQANLTLLTGTNTQIDAVNQAIAREESSKSLLESELATQLSSWKTSRAQGVTGTASPATMDTELKRKEDELAKLQEKFTDDWPAVRAKKQEIEDLKKKIATAAANPTPPEKKPDTIVNAFAVEPEVIQQLRTRIASSNLTIQDKERQLQKLTSDFRMYQGRVQSSPQVEAKYNELTRDSVAAQAYYNQLLHNSNEAATAAALQRRQQGEQFQLLDSANLPGKPTFPNPVIFAGGGFGGGLALGLALILLLEMRDKSLRTESDVEALLKVPILAMVPVMDKAKSKARIIFQARGETPSLSAKT
jgi:polysaccharide chain length determinant protein (PEP-CTERM system associated)